MHDELLLLRRFRTAKNLSIGQVAEAVGTSRQHMQRMETGERNISLEWLIKLAAFYDVPVGQLIRDGDGLSDQERDMIEFLRDNPQDAKILLSTFAALQDARKPAHPS